MIDKKFFKKYQKQLVWFINTWIGRWFFCVDKDIKNIHEVKPNAISYNKCYLLKDGEWRKQQTTCFRTHNKYALLINHRLRYFQRLGYLIPALLKPELGMAMMLFMPLTVSTFYPNSGSPGTTSIDGWATHNEATAWSTIVNGAGTYHDDTADPSLCIYIAFASPNWTQIVRSLFLFDTSALPDADTISAATLSLYGTSKDDTLSITPNVNIYSSNPASNTALANGDYATLGSTAFSSVISYASWNTAGYNNFVLNASGKSAISKTSISKFGARNAEYDAANSAPSTPGVDGSSKLYCNFAEQTGTDNDPKLVITHSSAANYEMAAALGTFTLTGVSIGAYFGRIIAALVGTFTLTGITTGLTSARNMIASAGSFALTGITTGLTSARSIIASLGTFTLTGIDVALLKGKTLTADVGSFTLTGISVGLTSARSIIASAGSFTLTGIATGLTSARNIIAGVGAFTLTGISTTLTSARSMVASAGSFALTGVAVTFIYGKTLVASVGEFIFNGIDVRLKKEWRKRLIKNVTTFTKQEKQTTNFSKQEKRESSWTKQPKP